LTKNLKQEFNCPDDINDGTECDNEISQKIELHPDTDQVLQKFNSAITAACDTTFQVKKFRNQNAKKRSVPWWTNDLTLLRKKTQALRCRLQRTKNDDNLRLERRQHYLEHNRIYIRGNFGDRSCSPGRTSVLTPRTQTRGTGYTDTWLEKHETNSH